MTTTSSFNQPKSSSMKTEALIISEETILNEVGALIFFKENILNELKINNLL